jgi:hypothetical protein
MLTFWCPSSVPFYKINKSGRKAYMARTSMGDGQIGFNLQTPMLQVFIESMDSQMKMSMFTGLIFSDTNVLQLVCLMSKYLGRKVGVNKKINFTSATMVRVIFVVIF